MDRYILKHYLLLIGKVMTPRLKTVKINGNVPLLKKKTQHLTTRLFLIH